MLPSMKLVLSSLGGLMLLASCQNSTPSTPKTAADLETEQMIREKIQKNQFIQGYSGGPVRYSVGGGEFKTFTP
jgi:hypothetical protein